MNAYLNAMRKYATFSGRATRTEFWLFVLFVIIGGIATIMIDVGIGFDGDALVLTGLWNLIHFLPALAVSIRRLHDSDRSGWWMLLALTGIGQFVLLVFYCLGSTQGPNRFGDNPHGINATTGIVGGLEGQQGAQSASGIKGSDNTVEQLEKLTALHTEGALDDAEFARMKADLLKKGE